MHCVMGLKRKSTRCDWRSAFENAHFDDVVPPRAATRDDLPILGRVLAEAFHHDPFHRWVFPTERAWQRGSHRLFTALLEDDLARATILTNPDCAGAAIWHGPDYVPRPWWRELTYNLRMLYLIGPRAPLIGHGMSRLARLHPRQPHWYLAHLGTDPGRQGQGIGSSLLSPILAFCDAKGQAAYLEASCEQNLPFYQRHGFGVVAQFRLPRGPRVWRMQRWPQ